MPQLIEFGRILYSDAWLESKRKLLCGWIRSIIGGSRLVGVLSSNRQHIDRSSNRSKLEHPVWGLRSSSSEGHKDTSIKAQEGYLTGPRWSPLPSTGLMVEFFLAKVEFPLSPWLRYHLAMWLWWPGRGPTWPCGRVLLGPWLRKSPQPFEPGLPHPKRIDVFSSFSLLSLICPFELQIHTSMCWFTWLGGWHIKAWLVSRNNSN